MEFRILGPLEVVEEGDPLPLGTSKERVVLAVLLLHANEFVSRERLIDEIWGAAPPPTARKAVNVYVSKLRKTLTRDGHDPIGTLGGGYRLELRSEDLDKERMQRLLLAARDSVAAGELETAADIFREALAFWRGPTLPDLPFESFARAEIEQLDEVRLTAVIDRIDCDLALGRHEQVLGELNVLVHEHPLRERLRAQQMLALYRADRQADALSAHADARRMLVDELGIEPSEALQRLQRAILRHDPALETPAGTADVTGSHQARVRNHYSRRNAQERAPRMRFRPRLRPRRRLLVVAALVVVAASAATAVIVATSSAHETPRVVPNSLVRIDPRSGKIVSVVRVGREPGTIATTPSAIWTANSGDGTVSRYDLSTHRVQRLGRIASYPYDIVADDAGNVWVSDRGSSITRVVTRARPGARESKLDVSHSATINSPASTAGSLALGGGYLWAIAGPLTLPDDNTVSMVNLATERAVRTLRLKGDTTAVAFADGAAWVSTNAGGNGLLYAIRAGAPLSPPSHLELGDSTFGIAVGEGHLWILTWGTNGGVGAGSLQQVLEIDPHTADVVRRWTFDGKVLWGLAVGGGSVWISADAGVIQLDPTSGRVVRTVPLSTHGRAPSCGIAATNDAVWVTVGDSTVEGACSTGTA